MKKIILSTIIVLLNYLVFSQPQIRYSAGYEEINNLVQNNEPAIAINPIDTNKIVIATNYRLLNDNPTPSYPYDDAYMGLYYTTDFGYNWNKSFVPKIKSINADPSLAYNNNGTLYYGFLGFNGYVEGSNNDGSSDIYVNKSTNNGMTWLSEYNTYTVETATSPDGLDRPRIHIDRSNYSNYVNRVYISYTKSKFITQNETSREIKFSYLDNEINQFATPVVINTTSGVNAVHAPFTLTDKFGYIYIFYLDNIFFQGSCANLKMVKMSQGGLQKLSEETVISNFNYTGYKAGSGSGLTFGGYFGTQQKQFRLNSYPVAALDIENNIIYLVWSQNDNESLEYSDIYLAKYFANTATWQYIGKINEEVGISQEFFPDIAINDLGEISIVYYSMENRAADRIKTKILFSDNGAYSFKTIELTDYMFEYGTSNWDISFFIGDYNAITTTNHFIIPAWTTNYHIENVFRQQIYSAYIPKNIPVNMKINGVASGYISVDNSSKFIDSDGETYDLKPFESHSFSIIDLMYDDKKFRNWNTDEYELSRNEIFDYESNDPRVNVYYEPTLPLTVTNNLEGGSYTKYKVKWRTTGAEETVLPGDPTYYAFDSTITGDRYDITAFQSIEALNTNWQFINWSDGKTSALRTEGINSSNNTFTANYKGINRSDNASSFSNNSQRKFVRTENGMLHNVYESMGHIWYETSTDNGTTWLIMNDGKPIDDIWSISRSPSIDYLNNDVFIVYHSNSSMDAVICQRFGSYGDYQVVDIFNPEITDDSKPVIAVTSEGVFVLWQLPNSSLQCKFWEHDLFPIEYDPYSIIGSNSNSTNPTLAVRKDGGSTVFHLAWQQENSQIKYCTLIPDELNNISQSTVETPSSGNGYSINIKPSIAFYYTSFYPTIIWLVEEPITYIQKVQLRIKYGTTWSQFWTWGYGGGNSIFSANINNNSSGKFVLAWGGELNDKYLTSQSTTQTYNLTTQGDVQVSNAGTTMGDMKIMSFDRWNSPHAFTVSPVTQGLYKTNSAEVVSKGFCLTNEAEIYAFDIGGIEADGNRILFNDSFDEDTTESENRIESEPFLLMDKSSFSFKMDYYSSVKEKAKPSEVLFKVKLIDVKSGDVLGVLKEENKQNVHYKNNGLKISTEGIGNREVKLLLEFFTDEFTSVKYNSVITDSTLLNKQNYHIINYAGDEIIKEYALLQNYPNPFNPVTTISYQLPSDGMVKLVVYDILGNEVETLVNKYQNKGRYEVKFSASALASGMYLYRLTSGNTVITKKMLLLK